jgi:hypothetical protein
MNAQWEIDVAARPFNSSFVIKHEEKNGCEYQHKAAIKKRHTNVSGYLQRVCWQRRIDSQGGIGP